MATVIEPAVLAEVSRSSVFHDLHDKFKLYQKVKVPVYRAISLPEQEIRWHVLKEGAYEILPPGPDGISRSRIFPGLWLAGKSLLAGETDRVFTKLQEGLAIPCCCTVPWLH